MSTVLETPEVFEHVEVETDNLPIERPTVSGARPGFWRTLAHRVTAYLPHTSRARYAPSYCAPRPCETPMDQLIREHPALSAHALAIV
jgi:hypothetical protein